MVHPFSRAKRVLRHDLKPDLLKANGASTGDVLSLIHDNQWLGLDFSWLAYKTMNQSWEYAVNQPGPVQEGAPFVAFSMMVWFFLEREMAEFRRSAW